MTPALRWAAIRAILIVSLIVRDKVTNKTVSTNHNFCRERRTEAGIRTKVPQSHQPKPAHFLFQCLNEIKKCDLTGRCVCVCVCVCVCLFVCFCFVYFVCLVFWFWFVCFLLLFVGFFFFPFSFFFFVLFLFFSTGETFSNCRGLFNARTPVTQTRDPASGGSSIRTDYLVHGIATTHHQQAGVAGLWLLERRPAHVEWFTETQS